MSAYIGLALIGVSLVGLILRTRYLYYKNRKERLHEALQQFVDMLVDLADSEDEGSA